MARKLSSGVMVALIAILSLFGSVGTTFAATAVGGPSLSKWVYAEPGELTHNGFLAYGTASFPSGVTENTMWAGIDKLLSLSAIPDLTTSTNWVWWHGFERHILYNDKGAVAGGWDNHNFYLVPKFVNGVEVNYQPLRENGWLYFVNSSGTKVDFMLMQYENSLQTGNYKWKTMTAPTQGAFLVQELQGVTHGMTLVIKKMSTVYDPNNPPPYAVPGNTEYDSSFPGEDGGTNPNPGNPDDPDFPTQPTPPDNNWDLIGWLKYLVDWLIYLVKCFVYFLKSFGTAIGDVVKGSASLISAMSDFFAFLPNQVTTIIGMGIVAMIIVGIVKR